MDRGPVTIRQRKIDDLIRLYKEAYSKISQEITDASLSGKIRRAKVMVRINRELTNLGVNVDEFVKTEIPQYYQDGANQALQDLRAMDVDLSASSGAVINKAAIAAFVDETSDAFKLGITTISRNANRMLSDIQKRQLNFIIAEGKLKGETRRAITADVVQNLKENGISALVDKSGRQWSFDTYAEMLVRTKAVEARNYGLGNKMAQYGYDLVQVSAYGSQHQVCRYWEGKILSMTGQTPGYPTYEDARADGLFHPNCRHSINVLVPELAAKTQAYDNPYLKTGDTPPAPVAQPK